MPVVLLASASSPLAVLELPALLLSSAERPMAVLLLPVVFNSALLPTRCLVAACSIEVHRCRRPCRMGLGSLSLSAKAQTQASTSGMRRRASREGDLPIDFIKRRVVIFCFSC